ncbi:MAG: AI-2E family transporter, partial [Oscillospiraceae bacterium]|nr:AI-2E family transporter [Oscillospiraceae bacterium]
KKFHYWLLQILIIAAIIYLCTKISFLFKPVAVLFSTLFVPIIITGFLYFLLNPIVKFLQKNKIPKTLAIIILYVGVIGIIILAIGSIVPMISKQVSELFSNIPKYADDAVKYFQYLNDTKQYKWIMNQESTLAPACPAPAPPVPVCPAPVTPAPASPAAAPMAPAPTVPVSPVPAAKAPTPRAPIPAAAPRPATAVPAPAPAPATPA